MLGGGRKRIFRSLPVEARINRPLRFGYKKLFLLAQGPEAGPLAREFMKDKILVLGNSNVDLIFRIPRFHHPGETIIAESMVTAFGGKGANQAITSKQLGGKVILMTKLGIDHYGESYLQYLIKKGIDQKWILRNRRLPTGMALIELTSKGENRIIASPGANGSLSEKDLKLLGSLWKEVNVFVAQLEIPVETVHRGLKMAKKYGAITLLNPSPPIQLSSDILSLVDFFVPNEMEAQFLTGVRIGRDGDIPKITKRLLNMGPKNVVITLGPKGLFFKNRSEEIWMGPFNVNVVDTTAAGDAFMGALACGLSKGMPIRKTLRLANGAGALACTKLGAQPSLPFRKGLEIFLSEK